MAQETFPDWTQAAMQFQQAAAQSWAKTVESFQQPGLSATLPPLAAHLPAVEFSPEKLQALQQQYLQDAAKLLTKGVSDVAAAQDRRFASDAWSQNPLAAFAAASYMLNARTLMGLADAVQGDAKTRARIRFAIEQLTAATAPSNFLAFNAEAQQKAIETQGESIAKGMQNLLHDLRQGHVSMTDESVFEVGKNVATSEGAVVFENELFQLIEYKPLTPKVFERPFLFVPPCINKFYILDLQPQNSLIRYVVEQGHRTFVVSWRNPDESLAHKTWDDYVEHAAIKAIAVTQDLTGASSINTLGFCVGGTILGTAVAVLAARAKAAATTPPTGKTRALSAAAKKSATAKARTKVTANGARAADATAFPVASMTLLTSMLDFSSTGVLDIFIDEAMVTYREQEMGKGGLMKGQDLASTFSFLRPNDLVWNYVVGNYLKGETPPPFDLLYWNSDSTNLPGPFYAWYLRHTYLENRLVKPNSLTVCGQKVDLGLVDIPVYMYGSREDHIVPIDGAYASTQVLPGEKRFVMGASGHIAGVINPPAKNKRSHWIRADGKLPATHEQWMAGAKEHVGSWWPDWAAWLKAQAGATMAAPKAYGSAHYKAIEPAPGRYVRAKV